jgi:polyhydroxybutyrate depolymerase
VAPEGHDLASPVLVLLHGFGDSAANLSRYLGIDAVAGSRGVIVVHVDGTPNPGGSCFWNATDACCDLYRQRPDDVGYLDAVLDDVGSHFRVDARRLWIVGHSNGGFMAYRYACERAPRVAAIASMAGADWLDAARCAASEPVAVLQIHGDADPIIKYGGGNIGDPDVFPLFNRYGIAMPSGGVHEGSYPGARAMTEAWARRDGCEGPAETGSPFDLDRQLPGAETTPVRWGRCKGHRL